ncbi:MAG: hypothetical protein WCG34_09100 [Leptolinea sp.]
MRPAPLKNRVFAWLQKPGVFPALIFLTLVAAYGLQIRSLGFYWDDWEDIFLYRLGAPGEFLRYFIYDRPTTIWVYLVFFPLLGDDPVKWQIFNLVLRYFSLLGLWWFFIQLWPKRKFEVGWLVLLLAVFPAFFQQTISVTYSRHFMALTLYSASLALMWLSLRYRRWFAALTILAALASFTQMMTIEYFFGFEILRPFFLWVFLRDAYPKKWKRLVAVCKLWLPYILPMVGFLYWRFVMFKPIPGTDDPNGIITMALFLKDPVGLMIHLVQNVLQDSLYLLIFIWTNTIEANQIDLASKSVWFGWMVGGVAALIAGLALTCETEDVSFESKENRRFISDWLVIGGIAFFTGGLPVWITDRQIIVGLWSDRFALGPMLGAGMILVLLVSLFGYRRLQKTILLGVLFALAISSQIRTVNRYRLNWEIQRDYYWQFYWRVPAMKPGTGLFGTKMPFGLIADYSVSYAINAIYAPGMDAKNVPYWFFSSMRAYGNKIPEFIPDLPVKDTIRNIKFNGSTSNGIVPHYKAGQACVRILRPEDEFSPLLSSGEIKLAQISNLSQILKENNDPRVSPVSIFGPEPQHGWCYFYEKADLARQYGEWQKIIDLGNQADEQGLKPAVGMEYQPFIEGYANGGKWEQAYQLTQKANALTENMGKTLCADWQRLKPIAEKADEAAMDFYRKTVNELTCQ